MIDSVELWNELIITKPHLLEIFEMDYHSKIPAVKLEELALTVFE